MEFTRKFHVRSGTSCVGSDITPRLTSHGRFQGITRVAGVVVCGTGAMRPTTPPAVAEYDTHHGPSCHRSHGPRPGTTGVAGAVSGTCRPYPPCIRTPLMHGMSPELSPGISTSPHPGIEAKHATAAVSLALHTPASADLPRTLRC